jgi:hypothetical protein
MDNYHHFSPGTTKKIKSNSIGESPDNLDTIDDGSTRYIMLVLQYTRHFQMKNLKVKLQVTQLINYIIYSMKMKIIITTKFETNRSQCLIYQRDGRDQRNLRQSKI